MEQRKERLLKLKEQKQIKKKLDERKDTEDKEWNDFKKSFTKLKYDTLDKIEDKQTFHIVKKYLNKFNFNDFNSIQEVKKVFENDISGMNKKLLKYSC